MNDVATERQLALLDKEDWRFHAVGPGGTGLAMLATTEKPSRLSNRVWSFGLPSAPAMYLDLARQARLRRRAFDVTASFIEHPHPQGTWPEDHRLVFDFFQEFSAEVVFSFLAIESFANEVIPADFVYDWTNGKKEKLSLTAPQIERQVSLDEKLKRVIPQAHQIRGPSGTRTWQHFIELKKVRDRLVHLKSIDRKSSGPEQQTIWGLMIAQREVNFAHSAYSIIAAFPSLVENRRWFGLAGELLRQS